MRQMEYTGMTIDQLYYKYTRNERYIVIISVFNNLDDFVNIILLY